MLGNFSGIFECFAREGIMTVTSKLIIGSRSWGNRQQKRRIKYEKFKLNFKREKQILHFPNFTDWLLKSAECWLSEQHGGDSLPPSASTSSLRSNHKFQNIPVIFSTQVIEENFFPLLRLWNLEASSQEIRLYTRLPIRFVSLYLCSQQTNSLMLIDNSKLKK